MTRDHGFKSSEEDGSSGSQSPVATIGLNQTTQEERGFRVNTTSSTESLGLGKSRHQPSPFLFINAPDENGKQNAESRMLVRSHVMSTFYRKKGSTQSREVTLARDTDQGGQTSKFRLETYPRRRKAKWRKDRLGVDGQVIRNEIPDIAISIPKELQGAGPLDPFAAAALPWDSNMQRLVHHYAADIPDSIHPLKYSSYHVQNFILKIGVMDAALLHAILAYALVHNYCFGESYSPSEAEKLEYVSSNPDVLYHKTQAIHMVNEKIALGEADDPSIATVLLLLWQYPWIQGAGEHEARIHYAGLKQMVECRGGLDNLPRPIANSIRFHGLKRSMLTWSKPQLPASVSVCSVTLAQLQVPITNTNSIFSRSPTYLAPLLGKELWQILLDLNQFTAFVTHYRSHQTEFGPDESISFEHWNAALENRLMSYTTPEDEAEVCNDNLKEALRIAAVLWISTGLWNFPINTSLVGSMSNNLVNILIASDLSPWRENFSNTLVWILVIGGCCTPDEGSRRTFLLGHLQLIVTTRRFESCDDLLKAMKGFIYMDGAYASAVKVLWKDIAEGLE